MDVIARPSFNASYVSCGLHRTCLIIHARDTQDSYGKKNIGDVLGKPPGMGRELWCHGLNKMYNNSNYNSIGNIYNNEDKNIINVDNINYESINKFKLLWQSDYNSDNNKRDTDSALGIVRVRVGHGHTCALFSNGMVECFGAASTGQLGYSDIITNRQHGPSGLNIVSRVKPINLGYYRRSIDIQPSMLNPDIRYYNDTANYYVDEGYTCSLLYGYDVKCWGDGVRTKGILGLTSRGRIGINLEEMGTTLQNIEVHGTCSPGYTSIIATDDSVLLPIYKIVKCPKGTYHSIFTEVMACSKCANNVPVDAYHLPYNNINDNNNRKLPKSVLGDGYICTTSSIGDKSEPCGNRCVECDAGLYSNVIGANHTMYCQECPKGKYSRAGASKCISCLKGFFSATLSLPCNINAKSDSECNNHVCNKCSTGLYQSKYGSTSCDLCKPGRYSYKPTFSQTNSGKKNCEKCPSGMFSEGSTNVETCNNWQHNFNNNFNNGLDLLSSNNCNLLAENVIIAKSPCKYNNTCSVTCKSCLEAYNYIGVSLSLPMSGEGTSIQSCACQPYYILDERPYPLSKSTCPIIKNKKNKNNDNWKGVDVPQVQQFGDGGAPCCFPCEDWMDCVEPGTYMFIFIYLFFFFICSIFKN